LKKTRLLFLVALLAIPSLAGAQGSMKKGGKNWTNLEKLLEDINNQYLCAYKYHKDKAQDCVDFRNKIWPDSFFEITRQASIEDKEELLKIQTAGAAAHPDSAPGTGPNPQEFKLMAVYGNVALATDRTVFKALDAGGKLVATDQVTALRAFVKLNGKWVPAVAVTVPLKSQ
jgi:hypothetical protein